MFRAPCGFVLVDNRRALLVAEYVLQELYGLVLFQLFKVDAFVLVYGRLGSIVYEVVSCAVFPTVQARLVLPLVVLPSQDYGVLIPYEALADFPQMLTRRSSEILALAVGVEYIPNAARFQYLGGVLERIAQKLKERAVVLFVVFDFQFVLCFSLVIDVVRWVGD